MSLPDADDARLRLWLSLAALLRHYALIFGGVVYIETLQYLDLLMDPVFGFPVFRAVEVCELFAF